MSVPFELGPDVTVTVTPPQVPTLAMAPPAATGVMVVPVPGPPGNASDISFLAERLQDLEDNPGSYLYEQDEPSTVWLITHPLAFMPAGIEVHDHVGDQHFPLVSWPDASTVRLDFNVTVRGTARLS